MGVSVYPRIENTKADWVHNISGKALSKGMERLFKLVKKQGHKDLMDYYVPSQEDLEDWNLDKEAEMQWFNPIEGLTLIEAMTRAFEQHQGEFEHPEHLKADLESFRKILERAVSERLRWNLGMSY